VALRPKKLSATQIETLIRDPYAVYARNVLKLHPFESLAGLPGAADRGNLVHDVLERFIAERPRGPFDDAAERRLLEIGRERFTDYADFPEIGMLWWPRFERIARWFVENERSRPEIAERLVEQSGRWQVTADFALTARADRLDRLADGTLAIVDYKTGRPPSNDEVLSLSPQLPWKR
jgi:ATP-dependent helicase/nuclease subunit B